MQPFLSSDKERIDLEFLKNKIENLEALIKDKERVVGIPTIDGYEFLFPNEIIRCEGLQKCTRILTSTKTDIISSYNIGEFKKLLESFHFYAPHKSHLINLAYVKKYKREGIIILRDNTQIPVSKRRKGDFLEMIHHL